MFKTVDKLSETFHNSLTPTQPETNTMKYFNTNGKTYIPVRAIAGGVEFEVLETAGVVFLSNEEIVNSLHLTASAARVEALKIENAKPRILSIKNTGYGFQRYGNCEICGERCDNHYASRVKSEFGHSIQNFGHVECLKSGEFANAPVDHSAN